MFLTVGTSLSNVDFGGHFYAAIETIYGLNNNLDHLHKAQNLPAFSSQIFFFFHSGKTREGKGVLNSRAREGRNPVHSGYGANT